MYRSMRLGWLVSLLLVSAVEPATTQEADRETHAFFENTIRPLLVEHCVKCHGAQKAESGLRLDTMATALQGGDRGPAWIPGQPADSLIIKAVRHEDGLEMPPDDKLEDRDIAALVRWIQAGAAWPKDMTGDVPKVRGGPVTAAERAFWSFQPVTDPQPPEVEAEPIKNDIDRFVNAILRTAESLSRPRDPTTFNLFERLALGLRDGDGHE